MEDPPKQFYRLAPGREVRLKHAYIIKCTTVVKDANGRILEIHCTYDPSTRGGEVGEGHKVKATLHWVSVKHAIDAEVRLYDYLFTTEDPTNGGDFKKNINPNSLQVLSQCKAEPSLASTKPGDKYQFLRNGYFCTDLDSTKDRLIFNRTVELKDSYSKIK
jgi:glutaminyl-tRNA synthetase